MRTQTPEYSEITLYSVSDFQPIPLPKFALNVECGSSTTGFASPADDYIDRHLDLNEYHRIRQHTTFLVVAEGESMIDAGIAENDVLIVDTSLIYHENDVVICCLNGSYKAKIIHRDKGRLFLNSRNADFAPIEILKCDDLRVFGVVKGLSRKFRSD